jgi:hypothetical protein
MQGIYRQRSYDNLQNGKSPFHRNSVRSLHLPSSTYNMSFGNNNQNLDALHKRFSLSGMPRMSPNSIENHAIPSNFKFVSPQTKYETCIESYDSNSLPRYPYHKNRAIHGIHHRYDGTCVVEYYRYGPVRHPLTPPPPPPKLLPSPDCNFEEQKSLLLPTPTSSTSSGEIYSSNSEYDPMIGLSKQTDHITHYRTCKKQLQQASQQLLQPNFQHQTYIDNYINQFTNQQSPYKRHVNISHSSHDQAHAINMHQVYHNPNKRHSNVYEYHFSNFDLNSIHEDGRHDS